MKKRIKKEIKPKLKKITSNKKISSENFEKQLEKEIKEVEKWVIERKKFFIKLVWIVILITILFVLSYLFLRVKGAGI